MDAQTAARFDEWWGPVHTDNSLEMTHLSVRPVLTITLTKGSLMISRVLYL